MYKEELVDKITITSRDSDFYVWHSLSLTSTNVNRLRISAGYYGDINNGGYQSFFRDANFNRYDYYILKYGEKTIKNDEGDMKITSFSKSISVDLYGIIVNTKPAINDNTVKNKTLYDGDVLNINGNVIDEDKGDVVTIRYNINNGTTRALSSQISQGTAIPYNKSLVFKEGYLHDWDTKVSNELSDGTKHLIKIWAEDDKGGKSEEVLINFYVVNNRPAKLIVNEIIEQNDLIETDTIQVTGKVSDPDKNETTLLYKVNSSGFTELNSGMDREFEIRVQVSRFHEGDNTVTIRARDEYGAITDKVVKIHKDKTVIPLKTAVREYKMLPPSGKAKGLLLWVQREIGDLTTKVEVKFGDNPYKELEVSHTAPVNNEIEEDEYVYEHDTEEDDIRLRITMNRSSTSSNKGIKLISGVFN